NRSVANAPTTGFGANLAHPAPPPRPDGRPRAGQVLKADRVTLEINTVFEQLTAVLSALEPEKLNTTLGAIAAATRGRGDQVGQMLTDLEAFLAELEPALPALRTDLTLAAPVLATYADAAQPLLDTAGHVTALGGTLLEEQQHLDAVLPALIGLADTGDRVLAANADALAATLDVLVPTTALTAEYREALYCSLDGFADLSQMPPVNVPGLGLSANFLWGIDPYRYPDNLPKLEASGGSQCSVLPVGYEQRPPFVVADVGANPFARGNQGILVNPENLPNALFGPPTEASR
ncbi:MCE family protein, partial [Nocardia farcinica]|uniref:MCE family protein n=1 Tax=Nocardia farcinica TaxID=37329 RepID=UPI0024574CC6